MFEDEKLNQKLEIATREAEEKILLDIVPKLSKQIEEAMINGYFGQWNRVIAQGSDITTFMNRRDIFGIYEDDEIHEICEEARSKLGE